MPNPYGQIVNTRNSNGLGVRAFWYWKFAVNEEAWKTNPTAVQTDEELVQVVLAAFPDRTWSRGLAGVTRWRIAYNNGVDLEQPPAITSRRYVRAGNRLLRFQPGAKTPEAEVKLPG